MLTHEEVVEFKRLVLEVYGIELTDAQALDQGSRLIMLFEGLIKANAETMKTHKKMVQSNG
ncbi:hypothetical protein HYT74_01260 [Candidatus Daviesbacteria bacterium]|nr:hypothetical protein [Candidatus Daviesbacteria bacterium]